MCSICSIGIVCIIMVWSRMRMWSSSICFISREEIVNHFYYSVLEDRGQCHISSIGFVSGVEGREYRVGFVRSNWFPRVGSVCVISLRVEGLGSVSRRNDVGLGMVSFVPEELEDGGKNLLSIESWLFDLLLLVAGSKDDK